MTTRSFQPKDIVRVRSHRGTKEKWVAGTVIKIMGPETYLVRTGSRIRYVHVDHLIESGEDYVPSYDLPKTSDRLLPQAGITHMPVLPQADPVPEPPVETSCESPAVEPVHTEVPTAEPDQSQETIQETLPMSPRTSPNVRPNLAATRPTRARKRPDKLIETID